MNLSSICHRCGHPALHRGECEFCVEMMTWENSISRFRIVRPKKLEKLRRVKKRKKKKIKPEFVFGWQP